MKLVLNCVRLTGGPRAPGGPEGPSSPGGPWNKIYKKQLLHLFTRFFVIVLENVFLAEWVRNDQGIIKVWQSF